jgi:hypothetical protein
MRLFRIRSNWFSNWSISFDVNPLYRISPILSEISTYNCSRCLSFPVRLINTTRRSVSEGKRVMYPFFSRRFSMIVKVDLLSCVSLAKIPIGIGPTPVTSTFHKILRILACSGLISLIPASLRSLPLIRVDKRFTRAIVTRGSSLEGFFNLLPRSSDSIFVIFIYLVFRFHIATPFNAFLSSQNDQGSTIIFSYSLQRVIASL